MDDKNNNYTVELASILEKLTSLTKLLILGFVSTICVMAISLCVATCYTQHSSDSAMTELFRLYMESDYEYPNLDINQNVDQRIGE